MEENVQTGVPGGGDSIELATQPSTPRKREKKTEVTQRKRLRSLTLRVLRKRKLRPARRRNGTASIRYETARARRLDQLRRLERRHVRKELSPFFQLRSRAREIYNTIENAISTALQKVETKYERYKYIPITLLKLEDPGLDFETYQYYMDRISQKHNQTAYDDWAWLNAGDGAPAGARGQQRTQRYEAAFAQVPGTRPLQDDERKALAQAAFRYNDPHENKLRILAKFHKERREFVSRRKPSWNIRYGAHSRRLRSPRVNLGNPTIRMRLRRFLDDSPVMQVFMRKMCCLRYTLTYLSTGQCKTSISNSTASDDNEYPLDNLPTFTYCSEVNLHNKIEKLPEVLQGAASECAGTSSITVPSSAKSASCMPLNFARWRCPSSNKVLPGTPSSFSAISDDSEEFDTTSSPVPGDPYKNVFIIDSEKAVIPQGSKVFREEQLHLLRPYGETRPVFVYNLSLERAASAQEVELRHWRYARPPCLCRPGFPQRGNCRNAIIPPSQPKELPYLLVLLFLIKLCLATAIALGMLYFFLKSNPKVVTAKQVYLNTFVDTSDTGSVCKYYIYDKNKNKATSLTVKVIGPFQSQNSTPHLELDLLRLYFKKSDFDIFAQNKDIKTEKLTDYNKLANIEDKLNNEEKPQVTSKSKLELTGMTCPTDLTQTGQRGVWFMVTVNWSYRYEGNIYSKRITKSMVISNYAILLNNTNRLYHGIEWITADPAHKTPQFSYAIASTSCFYTYSRLNIEEPPSERINIDWNKFHFSQFSNEVKTISGIFYDPSPGRAYNSHYVYGNYCTTAANGTCGREAVVEITYALKYCINSTGSKQSVAFAVKLDDWYPSVVSNDNIDLEHGMNSVIILIGGLYLLLLLQVHRTSTVVILGIASFTVLSLQSGEIEPESVRKYFEIEYVLPYVFIMMWNACLSETGLYDVLAIYSVKSLRKFAYIVPMLWFFVIGTTMLTDNVTAMMLLTPIAIRIFEELNLDPRPVLKSMIMMANIMSLYNKDGSLYNRMLMKKYPGILPFYKQNLNGFISFGVSIVYFTSYFLRYKTYTQEQNGLNVLKHELKLWNLVDVSHSPGGGGKNFMQTLFIDELHSLLKEQYDGSPVRLYKRHTRIREGAGKILVEMGFMMILFTLIYYSYREDSGISFGLGPQELIYPFLGLCLLLRADISWSIPFSVIWQRIHFSSILMITVFFFIGNVFIDFKFHESIRDIITSNISIYMLLISSASSAVFGLGATWPLINTMKLLKDAGNPLPPLMKATTVGINIGGTATMLGSVTALVTVGIAGMQGHHIGMIGYIRTMLPVTVLVIGCSLLTMF